MHFTILFAILCFQNKSMEKGAFTQCGWQALGWVQLCFWACSLHNSCNIERNFFHFHCATWDETENVLKIISSTIQTLRARSPACFPLPSFFRYMISQFCEMLKVQTFVHDDITTFVANFSWQKNFLIFSPAILLLSDFYFTFFNSSWNINFSLFVTPHNVVVRAAARNKSEWNKKRASWIFWIFLSALLHMTSFQKVVKHFFAISFCDSCSF